MFGRKGDGGRELPNGGERGERIETLIGKGCSVQGSIRAQSSLRVDGEVEGEIVTEGDVFVGERGRVTAGIKARNATVAGEVNGNVEAEGTLELLTGAQLHGDVRVGKLAVAPGANFEGACRMGGKKEEAPLWAPPAEN